MPDPPSLAGGPESPEPFPQAALAMDRYLVQVHHRFRSSGHPGAGGEPGWSGSVRGIVPHRAERVLRLAAEGGVGLEINTPGLRGSPGETLPALETLRHFRELGGEVLAVGSDSHHVAAVGTGLREALELARAAG